MTTPEIRRRIDDILRNPSEALDVEFKTWLDIANDRADQARLAKAILALANHGGGILILGFDEGASGLVPAASRPTSLSDYTTDSVNSIVRRFSEPEFHCELYISTSPENDEEYPAIIVPGGHHVPIRAKRSGPSGEIVQQNTYYIRRPGPQSETPQSGREWDALIRRCIANARNDLLDQFRLLMAGGAGEEAPESSRERLDRWCSESIQRWQERIDEIPPDSASRFPHGYYAVSYIIDGVPAEIQGAELREALRTGTVRHTGWPPFWVPTRPGIAPYIENRVVECWLGQEHEERDPSHADFWRVTPDAKFFLIRGYQEDGRDNERMAPGQIFDLTLSTWRMGEILLHAQSMAQQFNASDSVILFKACWTGLRGRELWSFANPNRVILDGHISRQDTFAASLEVRADQIETSLPELVERLISPLYEGFDFFQIPRNLIIEELARMRANRF